jgi:hypothetical protein
MSSLKFSWLAACALLAGCVHVEPNVLADSAPDPSAGYVSAMIAMGKTRGLGYAFAIQPVNGGKEYMLSMGAASHFKAHSGDDVPAAIKLPPGTYKVVTWMVYQTLFNEERFRAPLRKEGLVGKPFTVSAGSVTHLGNFSITTHKEFERAEKMTWILLPLPVTQTLSKSKVAIAYPNLATMPFSCMVCIDTAFP